LYATPLIWRKSNAVLGVIQPKPWGDLVLHVT